ncbi:hypothetical protein [Rhodococcoides yunnanense]|uniref:hypothetical protein n=1 Tax=Rhodococcoides yunnanense TaxID=278209 RepID=UPI00111493F0|nr:hypothetical protein [Rhodococcus yunnanensis]
MTIEITKTHKTGAVSYEMVRRYPDEETMESLAARVRPLMLGSETIAFKKVIDALRTIIKTTKLPDEFEPLTTWLGEWNQLVLRGTDNAQALAIQTDEGMVTDRDLMYSWLYGDVVHSNAQEDVKGATYEQRYFGAVDVLARIVDFVESALYLVHKLYEEGFVKMDARVFEEGVTVRDTTKRLPVVGAYAREVTDEGPPDFESIDLTQWENGFELMEEVLQHDVCTRWSMRAAGSQIAPPATALMRQLWDSIASQMEPAIGQ